MTQLLLPDDAQITEKDIQRAAIVRRVVEGLSSGNDLTTSCERAGISINTWRLWRESGHVQAILKETHDALTIGIRGVLEEAALRSFEVIASIAQGKKPARTDIKADLTPADVIAAHDRLWKVLGLTGLEDRAAESDAEAILRELREKQVSIFTMHVGTVNIGTSAEPVPVPTGMVVEGELIQDDENSLK